MKRVDKSIYLLLFAISLYFNSCISDAVFNEYKQIKKSTWHKDSTVNFVIKPKDTVSSNKLIITVRNTNEYSYSNIHFFTKIHFPDGIVITDTLQYEMTNADGVWLGSGATSVKDNLLIFKQHFVFRSEENYKIDIKHGMREEQLEGIKDIGLRIEKE